MDFHGSGTGNLRGYPANVGAGATNAATTPETSPIRDGVTNAEQNLTSLHEAISRLERRLDTVLRPLPPSTTSAGKDSLHPACSHVMGRLHILNEGLNGAIARLSELEGRIEV